MYIVQCHVFVVVCVLLELNTCEGNFAAKALVALIYADDAGIPDWFKLYG